MAPLQPGNEHEFSDPWSSSEACIKLRHYRDKQIDALYQMLGIAFFVILFSGTTLILLAPWIALDGTLIFLNLPCAVFFAALWLGAGNKWLCRLTGSMLVKRYGSARTFLNNDSVLPAILDLSETRDSQFALPRLFGLINQVSLRDIRSRVDYAAVSFPILSRQVKGHIFGGLSRLNTLMLKVSALPIGVLVLILGGIAVLQGSLALLYLVVAAVHDFGHGNLTAVGFIAVSILTITFAMAFFSARLSLISIKIAMLDMLLWKKDYMEYGSASAPADLMFPLQAL